MFSWFHALRQQRAADRRRHQPIRGGCSIYPPRSPSSLSLNTGPRTQILAQTEWLHKYGGPFPGLWRPLKRLLRLRDARDQLLTRDAGGNRTARSAAVPLIQLMLDGPPDVPSLCPPGSPAGEINRHRTSASGRSGAGCLARPGAARSDVQRPEFSSYGRRPQPRGRPGKERPTARRVSFAISRAHADRAHV